MALGMSESEDPTRPAYGFMLSMLERQRRDPGHYAVVHALMTLESCCFCLKVKSSEAASLPGLFFCALGGAQPWFCSFLDCKSTVGVSRTTMVLHGNCLGLFITLGHGLSVLGRLLEDAAKRVCQETFPELVAGEGVPIPCSNLKALSALTKRD